eukprot:7523227-Ditylum_brightwellii.AAC.1
MEDAPTTHQANNDALERHRIARQRKLKLEKELALENAKKSHQLALFYHEMYRYLCVGKMKNRLIKD